MLLIVRQYFLMMLSRKIIVRKTTLQATNKFFEVKIIHFIVQNNTYYSARSRWTKQQRIGYVINCSSMFPYDVIT